MFCTDGWHYVTEAYWAFSHAAEDNPDLAKSQKSSRSEAPEQRHERERKEEQLKAIQMMKALRCLRQVGILLPSGVMAKGSTSLIAAGPRLRGSKTPAVDLTAGTIGTGTFWDMYEDEDPALQRIELERAYGIFLGCPVMVKAEDINKAIELVFPWQTEGFDPSLEQASVESEADSTLDPPKPKRGRPMHLDGAVQKMVNKEFTDRLGPEGDLHWEQSKKAIDREAIEWVLERTCGFLEVKPRTMRAYMKDLYPLRGCGNDFREDD